MNKKKLKEKLHRQIDDLDDEMALQMLHDAATEYGKEPAIPEELTPEQMEQLKKSREQIKNGNFYTHEEVQQKIKEWRAK